MRFDETVVHKVICNIPKVAILYKIRPFFSVSTAGSRYGYMYSMKHVVKYVYSAYLGPTELRVNELVAPDKGYAQLSWHNPSARLYSDIVSLADIVDVDWNGCICPNSVLLHL